MKIFSMLAVLILCWSAAPAIASDESWPDTLVIGTAGRGGTYDVYGRGLADLIRRKLGITAVTRESSGPSENLELLARDKIQIGFATIGAVWTAANAGQRSRDQTEALDDVRALAPMYETAFHFVVDQQSPLRTIEELGGKKVGVGPADGTTAYYVPRIFKALGVNATFQKGDWAVLGDELREKHIDLLAVAGGTPVPELLELGKVESLRFLALRPEELLKAHLQIPELDLTSIQRGLYAWQQSSYPTLGTFNFVLARKDIPASLVIALLDALFSGQSEMTRFTSAAAETVPRNYTRNTLVPFHVGAVRWYERHVPLLGIGD